MKPPKCRLCHKEHYGLCKNVNLGPASAAKQAPVVSGDVASRRKPVNHRPQPVGDITAKAHDYGGHGNEVGSITVQALKMEQARSMTPSERGRKFRKAGGEALREANRLRMRAKRGG